MRYFSGKDNKFPHFFVSVLPFIQQVALELPHICSDPIPLLYPSLITSLMSYYYSLFFEDIHRYSQKDMKVCFGQKQIVSILSHAFLCTLPEPVECTSSPSVLSFPVLLILPLPLHFLFINFYLDGFDTQAVNFGDLYRSALSFSKVRAKLECIFHYFDRMSQKRMPSSLPLSPLLISRPPLSLYVPSCLPRSCLFSYLLHRRFWSR